jgi:hypothetical protein
MGEQRNLYRIHVLAGRPGGKKPLGSPRRGWEDNIKKDLRKIGWGEMDWINTVQKQGPMEGSCE